MRLPVIFHVVFVCIDFGADKLLYSGFGTELDTWLKKSCRKIWSIVHVPQILHTSFSILLWSANNETKAYMKFHLIFTRIFLSFQSTNVVITAQVRLGLCWFFLNHFLNIFGLGVCNIWIVQDLGRARFGSFRDLDHTRFGSCKICIVAFNSQKWSLLHLK
jgi:hypothetical protein